MFINILINNVVYFGEYFNLASAAKYLADLLELLKQSLRSGSITMTHSLHLPISHLSIPPSFRSFISLVSNSVYSPPFFNWQNPAGDHRDCDPTNRVSFLFVLAGSHVWFWKSLAIIRHLIAPPTYGHSWLAMVPARQALGCSVYPEFTRISSEFAVQQCRPMLTTRKNTKMRKY